MSTPILITIPSYVNTSRNSSLVGYKTTSNNENSITRGKKRRLDHLTWEEKVLRKKLKNRVAAQTSRDRKKAKMDEMENSLNILVKQNETLIKECQSLREFNEKLLKENAELREKMTSTSSCRHQPSAAGTSSATGSTPTSTDIDGMPSLADICGFDSEFDADKLEELAQSLLQDITGELEASSKRENIEGRTTNTSQQSETSRLVGTSSECMESSRNDKSINELSTNSLTTNLKNDISITENERLNEIDNLNIKTEVKEEMDEEVLYGTYDEDSNCITIVISDENDVCIEDAVTEVITTDVPEENNHSTESLSHYLSTFVDTDTTIPSVEPPLKLLSPIPSIAEVMSPVSSRDSYSSSPQYHKQHHDISVSDGGYESIGSPLSDTSNHSEFNDLWNESFQELFPSLL